MEIRRFHSIVEEERAAYVTSVTLKLVVLPSVQGFHLPRLMEQHPIYHPDLHGRRGRRT